MRASSCLLAAVLLTATSAAHAEPASAPAAGQGPVEPGAAAEKNLDEARRHFGRGVQLYRDRDFRGALAEFNRAYSIGPSYRILYNIGQAELELQDHAAALQTFTHYVNDAGTELTAAKREEAEAIISRARERVAEVTIRVNGADAEIFIDDVSAGKAPLTEPVIVSAGRHRITAVSEGLPIALRVLELAGGDHPEIELTLSAPVAVKEEPRPVVAPAVTTAVAAAPHPTRTPFWVSLGVTGALGAATLVTGILSLSAKQSLDTELDRFPTDEARVTSARSGLATTSLLTDVLGAATLVGAGVTTYFALTTLKSPSGSTVKVGLGPGSLMAVGQFQ